MLAKKNIARFAGPLTGLVVFGCLQTTDRDVALMSGILAWMAVWWVTEAIPMGMTALLPLVLFPLTGLLSAAETAPLYMHHIMFLFIGGFLLAFSLEKWGLHRRIALRVILLAGTTPAGMLLGFMGAAYLLSMWLSNTATVLVLLPATLAISEQLRKHIPHGYQKGFTIALLLGIAYGATIGGTATLVGTPPNLILKGLYESHIPGAQISFLQWFLFAFPISLVFFVTGFLVLRYRYCRFICSLSPEYIHDQYRQLGKPGFEEKLTGAVFITTIFLWFFRQDIDLGIGVIRGWSNLFPYPERISDSTVAIAAGILLFLLPSKEKGKHLLGISELRRIPFDLLFLMGGGIVVAKGFTVSGLDGFLQEHLLPALTGLPTYGIIALAVVFILLLTELTSNSPSTSLVLPVLLSVCAVIQLPPLLLLAPATIAASYAFMLPVATPPNVIVYASGKLPLRVLIRNGIWFNLIGLALVMIGTWVLGGILGG